MLSAMQIAILRFRHCNPAVGYPGLFVITQSHGSVLIQQLERSVQNSLSTSSSQCKSFISGRNDAERTQGRKPHLTLKYTGVSQGPEKEQGAPMNLEMNANSCPRGRHTSQCARRQVPRLCWRIYVGRRGGRYSACWVSQHCGHAANPR